MNENSKKKRNTAIFMVIATVINIVLMTVFMLIGYILLVRFADPEKPEAGQIWLIVIFIGSIILAWFVYSRMIKWYTKRVDVNEKFAPLITPKPRKKKMQGDDENDSKR
ncbi:MAG: leader peptide processing enzyme [Spirochaetales bacterium]|nr:leader peptide processing enzyme [Spirochaetales bacterium]